MFFRLIIIFHLLITCSFVRAQVSVVDGAGRAGVDAVDGKSGHTDAGSGGGGGNGTSGSSASYSVPGGDAANVSIELRSNSGNEASFESKISFKQAPPRISAGKMKFGSRPLIKIQAQGGRGGRGGVGGDGGNGGAGEDGRDAFYYSPATPGRNGGYGGNGGSGTPGADGGAGGKVTISAKDADTHLFMLIGDVNVKGGAGGASGQNGQAGRGGQGGRGGQPFTWVTTYSCGTAKSPRLCTQWHMTPGASDGAPGPSGQPGFGPVDPGNNGADGSIEYRVGQSVYSSRYDVRVLSFELVTIDDDGIFEPGEKVLVRNIQIQNVGGMPTPSAFPVALVIRNSKWVLSSKKSVKLTSPLIAGAVAEVPGPIEFSISTDTRSERSGQPLLETQSVAPNASQTGVDIDFAACSAPKNISVQYPLKVERILGRKNLAPGEKTIIRWKITNISTKSYGKNGELQRSIATVLRTNCDQTTSSHFDFYDSSGSWVDLNAGLATQIPEIKPGETITISGVLTIPEHTDSYQKVAIDAELWLGGRKKNSDATYIQGRTFVVNVAHLYHHRKQSDFVLVTNHDTTADELNQWHRMLRQHGLSADIWDMSLRGGIDLEKVTSTGAYLYEDIAGKTLVVLNNSVEGVAPVTLLSNLKILKHLLPLGTRICIVGGDRETIHESVRSLVRGVAVSDKDVRFRVTSDLEELIGWVGKKADGAFNVVPALELIDTYSSSNSEEQTKKLSATAAEITQLLQERYPERRFIVVYTHVPSFLSEGLIYDTRRLGYVRIYEGVKPGVGLISGIVAPGEHIHSASFIAKHDTVVALLSSLPFERKLDAIRKIFRLKNEKDQHWAKYCAWRFNRALFSDLSGEWNAIVAGGSSENDLFAEGERNRLSQISTLLLNELSLAHRSGNGIRIQILRDFAFDLAISVSRYAFLLDVAIPRQNRLREVLLDFSGNGLALIIGSRREAHLLQENIEVESKLLVGRANGARREQMRLSAAFISDNVITDLSLGQKESIPASQKEYQNILNQLQKNDVRSKVLQNRIRED